MKRSRTTEWRRRKRLRLGSYSISSDESENRLYRINDHESVSQSSEISTQNFSETDSFATTIFSRSSIAASLNNPSVSGSTVESALIQSDNLHDAIPESSEEAISLDNSSIELSTEDDDSEDEAYREWVNDETDLEEAEENGPFQKLKNVLETDENVTLTVTLNKAELLLAGLKYGKEYGLCHSAMADLFKLINSTLQKKILPETKHLVDQLFNSDSGIQYHAMCPNVDCNSYVGEFSRTDRQLACNVCGEVINLKSPCYTSFFVIFDIENECSNLIQQNLEHITTVIEERLQERDTMTDFTHGNLYKEFVRSLPPHERYNFVSATFNSDGAPIFESSKYSIWPIQLIINELPYDIRTAFTITCALWFGKFKPDMNIYLRPFVTKMTILSNIGIPYKINNEVHRMKIHTLCCCVDASARAPMQGIVQYNGYFGCSWCLHPGAYVPTLTGGCVKYVLLQELPPKRTQLEMLRHMELSLESDEPIFGVKRPTCLVNIPHFNWVRGLVPDALHMGPGTAEQFCNYWFETSNMPFSLSNDDKAAVERMMLKIKVPNQITRLTRGIKDKSWWNSREWENWIMFYSLIILCQFPHMRRYALHWSLYVEAFYINHKSDVRPDELQRAHELFLQFSAETEFVYTQHSMTYNVHQSEHMTQSTVDWGPAFNHSGYTFESGNGRLLRRIHAANGVLFQLCRSVNMGQSEVIIRQHVEDKPFSQLRSYVHQLDTKYAKFSLRGEVSRYFGPYTKTKGKWKRDLQLSRYSRTYTKMVKDGCLYTTSRRKRIRSNNSFALTINGHYVQLRDFIYDEETSSEYALCKRIDVHNPYNSFPIKQILEVSKNVYAIEVAQIYKICVYVANDDNEFLCAVPNMFHY